VTTSNLNLDAFTPKFGLFAFPEDFDFAELADVVEAAFDQLCDLFNGVGNSAIKAICFLCKQGGFKVDLDLSVFPFFVA